MPIRNIRYRLTIRSNQNVAVIIARGATIAMKINGGRLIALPFAALTKYPIINAMTATTAVNTSRKRIVVIWRRISDSNSLALLSNCGHDELFRDHQTATFVKL